MLTWPKVVVRMGSFRQQFVQYMIRIIPNVIAQFLANVNSRSLSLYVIAVPSVCRLAVCLLSVTFVRPTQPVEIFGNFSSPFGTLAIR